MNILRMLPLLKGWVYEGVELYTVTVLAGKEWVAISKTKPGWVWTAFTTLSSNQASVNLVYDEYIKATVTPLSLYTLGLTAPAPAGLFCPKYTAGPPPTYVVAFLPADPVPFNKKVSITIKNPTALPLVIYNYAHLLILIDDEDLFRKSIKDILGVKEV